MRDNVRKFIEDNIEFIEDNQFKLLHELAMKEMPFQVGNFFTILLRSGVDVFVNTDTIYDNMFSNSEIKSLNIPDHIHFIKEFAFVDCFVLTSITLPKKINIDERAFFGCYELEHIKYKGTVEEFKQLKLPTDVFEDCPYSRVECTDGIAILSEDWGIKWIKT